MKDGLLRDIETLKQPGFLSGGFRVYQVHHSLKGLPDYSRKDFYRVCLHHGKSTIHYANKSIHLEGYNLFFGKPHIPYSWIVESPEHNTYSCIFSEDFFNGIERLKSLQESPLLKIGGTPVYTLTEKSYLFVKAIFEKMIEEQSLHYQYKQELIRNYINLIVHEAHKSQPLNKYLKSMNASSRIADVFMELLNKQFPISCMGQHIKLKTPKNFAQHLNIHVNHLNRSVKEVTGKTTKEHITEKIAIEAKLLLLHTDWNVAEIAHSLGFEYPTYFNNFFKRVMGCTPNSLRRK